MKKIFGFLLMFIFVLVVSNGQALASSATATAYLDLSTGYNALVSLPGLTPGGAPSLDALATNNIDPASTGTFVTPNYVTASVTNASAIGSLESSTSGGAAGYLYATATANPGYYDPAGFGQAQFAGNFTFAGTGTGNGSYGLALVLPYAYSYNLVASPGATSSATGFASYELSYTITNSARKHDITKNFTDFISLSLVDGVSQNISNSGKIVIPLTLLPGDTGTYTFNVTAFASASQPVPIPGAAWLLGSGLLGLLGFRRKFSK